MKICVIGCGQHSVKVYGLAVQKYGAVQAGAAAAACCDADAARAEAYRQQFGFARAYTGYEEMLRAESPDAVLLVVPVALTCAIAADILEKGVPLLLEKPPGASPEETRRLIAVQRQTGTPHRVAFNRRHMPQMVKLRALLRQHGQPASICYHMIRHRRFEEDFSTTAIHAIDAVRFIAGADYDSLTFDYQPIPGQKAVNIFVSGQTAAGCRVRINILPGAGQALENVTAVAGWHNYYAELPAGDIAPPPWTLTHCCNETQRRTYTLEELGSGPAFFEAGGFYEEIASFLEALRRQEGGALQTDLADALQSVQVAQCIRRREGGYRHDG